MSDQLKTLEQYNKERFEALKASEKVRPNGIACPRCNSEMVDSGDSILTSLPPQMKVDCPACGYRGYRLA